MKNKPNLITLLITLLLTMLFSFTVTSMVWARCSVVISPGVSVILSGESITLTAETEGEGCNEPNYTWEISEGTCTGGNIDPDTGTYTAGAEDNICQDTIMVTDLANRGITDTAKDIATVTVGDCLPSVSISGPATLGPPCPVSATYTAETVVCDIVSGTYTWELDGEPAGTGNTFEVTCTEDGIKTLMVTDIANGNVTDSITILCVCHSDDFNIYASITGCGTPFIPWFGVVEIEGTPLIVFGLTNIVRYDSPLVLKTPKLLNRGDNKITQFVILLPSILFPEWDYPATVKVSVDGPSDTIEIPACGQ